MKVLHKNLYEVSLISFENEEHTRKFGNLYELYKLDRMQQS